VAGSACIDLSFMEASVIVTISKPSNRSCLRRRRVLAIQAMENLFRTHLDAHLLDPYESHSKKDENHANLA
jgi:hypothetical protein